MRFCASSNGEDDWSMPPVSGDNQIGNRTERSDRLTIIESAKSQSHNLISIPETRFANFSVIMVASQVIQAYRQDARSQGRVFTAKEREELLRPYLPKSGSMLPSDMRKQQPIRDFLRLQLHIFVYHVIHAIFSLYIRVRQTYHIVLDRAFAVLYYHHRAPELIRQDVRGLSRLPDHLSVILELKGSERGTAGLEGLMDDLAEISAWCACIGIPMLSVYEKTGKLVFTTSSRRISNIF